MFFGLQLDSLEPVEQHASYTDNAVFHHNLDSFDMFWQEVGAATGSTWRVDAKSWKIPEIL